jgi:hypothetical protein
VGRKVVKNKWVFKHKADGRFRARLVALGFMQVFGIDFSETFSPVARYESIRLLLALAMREEWEIHAMDTISAFLNGDLDEEIYMEQPEGFASPGQEDKVCKLQKALYGLKQAAHAWNKKFHALLVKLGFTRCYSDSGVYIYRRKSGNTVIILILYVDDLLLLGNSLTEIVKMKKVLASNFDMTDLGEAKSFLGLTIVRNRHRRTLTINQSKYIEDVLKRFNMTDCNPTSTPLPAGIILEKSTEEANESYRTRYQQIIGSLMYAAIGSRPDISFAVMRLAQYSSNPSSQHMSCAFHVLKYLRGTQRKALCYHGHDEDQLYAYSDSDWAEDRDDRRSTTGFCFFLSGSLISWVSRKQDSISMSSCEAEYRAMSEAAKQAKWYQVFLSELGLDIGSPITLYCDNKGAKDLAEKPSVSRRSKHFEVHYHFIREAVSLNIVSITRVPSAENIADSFTKSLSRVIFSNLINQMGFVVVDSP